MKKGGVTHKNGAMLPKKRGELIAYTHKYEHHNPSEMLWHNNDTSCPIAMHKIAIKCRETIDIIPVYGGLATLRFFVVIKRER